MNPERNACALTVLPSIFRNLTDPRDPRGVRHPYAALCSLVFLGMLAPIVEMAVLKTVEKKEPKDHSSSVLYYQRCRVPSERARFDGLPDTLLDESSGLGEGFCVAHECGNVCLAIVPGNGKIKKVPKLGQFEKNCWTQHHRAITMTLLGVTYK